MLEDLIGTIQQGDCQHILPTLPDGCVDMVYLDPPYNMRLGNAAIHKWKSGVVVQGVRDGWDQVGSFEEYDAFIEPVLVQLRRLCAPSGSVWVSGTYHNIHRIGSMMQDLGYWLFSQVEWLKKNPMPNFRMVRPQLATETLLWAVRDESCAKLVQRKFDYQQMKAYTEADFGTGQALSAWWLPVCLGSERLRVPGGKAVHSTQKPLELVRRMISVCTKQGDLVLDPMCGTGTTAVAAAQLRRRWIAIELREEYVSAARFRMSRLSPLEVTPEE